MVFWQRSYDISLLDSRNGILQEMVKHSISVIVPVYNGELYIAQCIRSIQRQNVSDIQIIIVNDGSTDSSLEIIQRFAESDEKIIVISIPNGGVSNARNIGLQYATGDYVGFVDCDDWIEPQMYSHMLSLAYEHDLDIVIEPPIFEVAGKTANYRDSGFLRFMDPATTMIEMLRGKLYSGQLWNKIIRRSLIGQNFCDAHIRLYEDLDALCRIIAKSKQNAFTDFHHYHYRIHAASAMHQNFSHNILDAVIVSDRILRDAKRDNAILPYAQAFSLNTYHWVALRSMNSDREIFLEQYSSFRRCARECFTKDSKKYISVEKKLIYQLELSSAVLFRAINRCILFLKQIKHRLETDKHINKKQLRL